MSRKSFGTLRSRLEDEISRQQAVARQLWDDATPEERKRMIDSAKKATLDWIKARLAVMGET